MVNVKGKWALITGAARGIGYGAAKFMAERGFGLTINTMSGIRLEPEQAGYYASTSALKQAVEHAKKNILKCTGPIG